MHFEVSGSGKTPLLCIHGWCCNGAQFSALAAALNDEFRIYRPDLPGHGKTPIHDFRPTFENYAAAVVDFALQQQLENPVLLGHSMGGVLSLMAAASPRLRPRAIINLDGGLPPAPHTLAGQSKIRAWLAEPDFRAWLTAALRESFFLPQERDARCDEIIRAMCSAPDAVLRFLPEQIGNLDAASILPRIAAPVLYIGAQIPRFDSGAAARLLDDLHEARIPNAGHFLHIYALPELLPLAKSFLHSAACS